MDSRANPLMDQKVVGAVLFRVVAVVTSPTTAECSVVWHRCSCSCSCSVRCSCSCSYIVVVVVV